MKTYAPISSREFLEQFLLCIPSATFVWKGPLAVATSGGPDSTCLLFLLRQILSETCSSRQKPPRPLPPSLLAINIDHDLQAASAEMSRKCSQISKSLDIPHTTIPIHWGKDGAPALPSKSAFEGTARTARYHAIWQGMQQHQVRTVAMGHHADDQLETALLRIARGSGTYGAAGMAPFRRWGAGWDKEDPVQYGVLGLQTWLLRPLLRFSKARILATCEENRLEYVLDQTNFQPNITYRNAIRHWLSTRGPDNDGTKGLSPDMKTYVEKVVDKNIKHGTFDLSKNVEELYPALVTLEENKVRIEQESTQILQSCRRPSPPSTLVLASDPLSKVADKELQTHIITKALRYVSAHPFGSLAAQAGRQGDKLDTARKHVFVDPARDAARFPFQCGALVSWRPVTILPNGDFVHRPVKNSREERGWLLHRAKPYRGSRWSIEKDVTPLIHGAAQDGSTTFLFDARFELTFDVHAIARELSGNIEQHRFFIESDSLYHLPRFFACDSKSRFTEFRIQYQPDLEEERAEDALSQLHTFLSELPKTPTVRWQGAIGQPPTSNLAEEWRSKSGELTSVTLVRETCVSARFFRLLDTAYV